MESNALAVKPSSSAKGGIVHSNELSRPVGSLSECTSECMALLDSLHTAIYNTYGASSGQAKLFTEVKAAIRWEWERWLSFQQQCLAYARNYILVCSTPQPNNSLIAPTLVVADAKQLEVEAGNCRISYAAVVQQFASLAHQYEPPTRSQPVWKIMRIPITSKMLQFILSLFMPRPARAKATHNLPVVLHAFATSITSLRAAIACLVDIQAFWSDHASTVTELAASPSGIAELVHSGELRRQAEKWSLFQASMRQSLSDITAYCDALTVKPINNLSVKSVSLWTSTFAPEMNTEESAKIQEAGYFEVLTALEHFEVSSLTTTTASLNKRLQTALGYIGGATSSDLKSHVERYFATMQTVRKIATSGSDFYAQAQRLAPNEENTDVTGTMHSAVTKVHVQSRTLLTEYEGLHSRLTKSISASKVGDNAAIKSLRSGLDDLRRLISLYADLDHFWFGLLAGVRYLDHHGFAHVTDVPTLKSIWRKQARAYAQYAMVCDTAS